MFSESSCRQDLYDLLMTRIFWNKKKKIYTILLQATSRETLKFLKSYETFLVTKVIAMFSSLGINSTVVYK
jgi:hypothetical protein